MAKYHGWRDAARAAKSSPTARCNEGAVATLRKVSRIVKGATSVRRNRACDADSAQACPRQIENQKIRLAFGKETGRFLPPGRPPRLHGFRTLEISGAPTYRIVA